MEEFRKNEERNAKLLRDMFPGSQADPLDRRIDGIDRKLRECHNYFINVFKADNESLGSPTCDVIASSILGRSDADSTDYDALIEKLEGEELSQLETVDSFLQLISLYIERGRLRRVIMQKAEAIKAKAVAASGGNSTGKKSGYSWEKDDHYVMTFLEHDGRHTLARLLQHQSQEIDKKTKN